MTTQSMSTPGPWEAKHLDATHFVINSRDHGTVAKTVIPIGSDAAAIRANALLLAAAPAMRTVLESICTLIAEAEDQKVRTGRLPPIGKILSEIQDSARSVLDEVRL